MESTMNVPVVEMNDAESATAALPDEGAGLGALRTERAICRWTASTSRQTSPAHCTSRTGPGLPSTTSTNRWKPPISSRCPTVGPSPRCG